MPKSFSKQLSPELMKLMPKEIKMANLVEEVTGKIKFKMQKDREYLEKISLCIENTHSQIKCYFDNCKLSAEERTFIWLSVSTISVEALLDAVETIKERAEMLKNADA